MPFCQKLGGNDDIIKDSRRTYRYRNCLTPWQTNFIYKKVELCSLINKNTIREEIHADMELDRVDDNRGDKNPYKELIVNSTCKVENTLSQMEQWSILSNVLNYMQYSKNPKNFYSMIVEPVNSNRIVKEMKGRNIYDSLLKVDLVDASDRSKEEYLDKYEGIKIRNIRHY